MIDFSVVDLRLEAKGNVYGAALLHLLQALPIHTSISKVRKVTLLRLEKSEVTLFFAYMSDICSTSPVQFLLLLCSIDMFRLLSQTCGASIQNILHCNTLY